MTDEELIAYLRLQGLDKDIAAADRIEQLVATNEALIAERAELDFADPSWTLDKLRAIPTVQMGAKPEWLTNCAVCGRVVDTREASEGGDDHGCEYDNGWACSPECAETLSPDPDWMTVQPSPEDLTRGSPTKAERRWKETTMSEEPFYIRVVGEVEHEDGSATYSFELDEKAQKGLAKLGLELSLYCAAYRLDIQEVFDHIALVGKSREKGEAENEA